MKNANEYLLTTLLTENANEYLLTTLLTENADNLAAQLTQKCIAYHIPVRFVTTNIAVSVFVKCGTDDHFQGFKKQMCTELKVAL